METLEIEKGKKQLALIIRTFPDLGIAKLISADSNSESSYESPVIEFSCENGRYLLSVDGHENIIDPAYLSPELKQLVSEETDDKSMKIAAPPALPSKADISRRDRYMLFSSYNAEVNLRESIAIEGDDSFLKRFPRLPREIYVELVRQYLREDGYPNWYLYYDLTQ